MALLTAACVVTVQDVWWMPLFVVAFCRDDRYIAVTGAFVAFVWYDGTFDSGAAPTPDAAQP